MNKLKFSFGIYPFAFLIILGCHPIKTKLSTDDLKWIDVYNEGDTLIFKSNAGAFDTTFIVKKEVYYSQYNPIEVHDKYLPQSGVIWYKNRTLSNHPEGYRLVTLIKKQPTKSSFLSIDYLYSGILFQDIARDSVKNLKKGKVYEFNTYKEGAKSLRPKTIFWHEDYGIIRYITHDNAVWERINL